MKARIKIYTLFGLVCLLGIGLYFVNPNLPVFQVFMSFSASLIGAIFVAVSLEAINNSKQKKSVKSIQMHLLSSTRQSFKAFYIWLGNYIVRKFDITSLDFDKIESSTNLYSELFFISNQKLKEGADVDADNIIDVVSGKINNPLNVIEQLNNIIDEEIATLITNEVLDDEDVEFFTTLKTRLLNAQSSESYDELCNDLVEVLNLINSKQVLRLEKEDLLTERLIRKFKIEDEKTPE